MAGTIAKDESSSDDDIWSDTDSDDIKMEVTIAKDQPMEYLPRNKIVFKKLVERHDFLVKCRPQNVITKEGENPAMKSILGQLGVLSGSIRVFMGPSYYADEQHEYYCGLWVRDLRAFLKKVFMTVEEDEATLVVSVKHQGSDIGEFRLCLTRDSSNPRTQVKCGRMEQIAPGRGQRDFFEFFKNVTSGSFTVTMVLQFEA